MTSNERQLEEELISKLQDLKYVYRADIRDRLALEQNFRAKLRELKRVSNGFMTKTIGVPFFRDLNVAVPSQPEQQRIADCLFSLGAEIAAEFAALGALKAHKNGLMQQLFPSPAKAEA